MRERERKLRASSLDFRLTESSSTFLLSVRTMPDFSCLDVSRCRPIHAVHLPPLIPPFHSFDFQASQAYTHTPVTFLSPEHSWNSRKQNDKRVEKTVRERERGVHRVNPIIALQLSLSLSLLHLLSSRLISSFTSTQQHCNSNSSSSRHSQHIHSHIYSVSHTERASSIAKWEKRYQKEREDPLLIPDFLSLLHRFTHSLLVAAAAAAWSLTVRLPVGVSGRRWHLLALTASLFSHSPPHHFLSLSRHTHQTHSDASLNEVSLLGVTEIVPLKEIDSANWLTDYAPSGLVVVVYVTFADSVIRLAVTKG